MVPFPVHEKRLGAEATEIPFASFRDERLQGKEVMFVQQAAKRLL